MALTTTQLQVIKALVSGSTIKDAAEAAGVHRSTVHDWTRVHHEFRAALDAARHHSTAFIRKCIEDETMPTAIRLRAALAVVKSVPANAPARRERDFNDLVEAAVHAADRQVALDRALSPSRRSPNPSLRPLPLPPPSPAAPPAPAAAEPSTSAAASTPPLSSASRGLHRRDVGFLAVSKMQSNALKTTKSDKILHPRRFWAPGITLANWSHI